jgi:hypothetical protein
VSAPARAALAFDRTRRWARAWWVVLAWTVVRGLQFLLDAARFSAELMAAGRAMAAGVVSVVACLFLASLAVLSAASWRLLGAIRRLEDRP